MPRLAYCNLLIATLGLASCISTDEYMRLKGEKEALQRQHDDLVRYQKEVQDRLASLEENNRQLTATAKDASAVKDLQQKLQDALDKLNQERGATLDLAPMEGVTIVQRADGVGFQVEGNVLFESGQAVIKDSGKETLKRLIPNLAESGGVVRVDGHTDDQPISRSRWRSNLHLSCERASQVAEFLVANGLPAERVVAAGYGEFRPLEAGDTEEARRKNRRVEILLLR